MEFFVEEDVRKLGVKILAVTITGVNNKEFDSSFLSFRESEINRLLLKYKDFDLKFDSIIEGFYELHSKVGVSRRKNLPASENLIKLLSKRGDIPYINKAVDIYNILSIDSRLCLGAHDISKIAGNVTLKITDGSEKFIPLGSSEKKPIGKGEYSFVDEDNDVICWLDIRQVDKTKVDEDSQDVLYFIIGNSFNTWDELQTVAKQIIELTTKFCGGVGELIDIKYI